MKNFNQKVSIPKSVRVFRGLPYALHHMVLVSVIWQWPQLHYLLQCVYVNIRLSRCTPRSLCLQDSNYCSQGRHPTDRRFDFFSGIHL